MEIKPLFQIRYAPKNIVDFYYRNFDYIYFKADGYEGIPMVKIANSMICEGYYKEPFPFGEYARGFCEEYTKDIKTPYVICENTLREVLISKILYRTGILPCEVDLKKPEDRIINLKAVYDWGKNTAIEFKTWEKILETPQYFTDFYPFIEQKPAFERGLNSPYTDETLGNVYDRLKDLGWFIGEKSNFIAIFRPEPAPDGWQPIEYIKKWGDKPHKGALANLVYKLSPDVGCEILSNKFFTIDGKPFEIDTDRKAYKTLEHDLNFMELKKR